MDVNRELSWKLSKKMELQPANKTKMEKDMIGTQFRTIEYSAKISRNIAAWLAIQMNIVGRNNLPNRMWPKIWKFAPWLDEWQKNEYWIY